MAKTNIVSIRFKVRGASRHKLYDVTEASPFQSALRFAVLPDTIVTHVAAWVMGFQSALRFAVLPDRRR